MSATRRGSAPASDIRLHAPAAQLRSVRRPRPARVPHHACARPRGQHADTGDCRGCSPHHAVFAHERVVKGQLAYERLEKVVTIVPIDNIEPQRFSQDAHILPARDSAAAVDAAQHVDVARRLNPTLQLLAHHSLTVDKTIAHTRTESCLHAQTQAQSRTFIHHLNQLLCTRRILHHKCMCIRILRSWRAVLWEVRPEGSFWRPKAAGRRGTGWEVKEGTKPGHGED
jgi:hypothetical protein